MAPPARGQPLGPPTSLAPVLRGGRLGLSLVWAPERGVAAARARGAGNAVPFKPASRRPRPRPPPAQPGPSARSRRTPRARSQTSREPERHPPSSTRLGRAVALQGPSTGALRPLGLLGLKTRRLQLDRGLPRKGTARAGSASAEGALPWALTGGRGAEPKHDFGAPPFRPGNRAGHVDPLFSPSTPRAPTFSGNPPYVVGGSRPDCEVISPCTGCFSSDSQGSFTERAGPVAGDRAEGVTPAKQEPGTLGKDPCRGIAAGTAPDPGPGVGPQSRPAGHGLRRRAQAEGSGARATTAGPQGGRPAEPVGVPTSPLHASVPAKGKAFTATER